jgi:hypothetical protein
MDGMRQLEAIHGARHLNVGEKQIDVGARLQNSKRVFRIDGFNRIESRILHDIDGAHSQDHFVFDYEDGRSFGRRVGSHGALHFLAGCQQASA